LADPALWDLRLNESELAQARDTLSAAGIEGGFLALSVGTKVEVKDWTEPNWLGLMRDLQATHGAMPIVAVGSAEESDRTERCLALWRGPKLNLCGRISVRTVAAVLGRARVFIGHDSGPMHLAATMGVPCVAIFAARNWPGQWYPRGQRNAVIYHQTECYGCGLEVCTAHHKKCIMGITVSEVGAAVRQILPALRTPTAVV
jgi:ADP-heptose:LPS heptosyltransferase